MKLKITFVIEEWSQSTKGGRSTFMRQMAIVLSRLENVEICILIPYASPEDREDAQKYNIKVFEAKKYTGYEPVDCLQFPPEGFSSDYIICYGIEPGRHGQVFRDNHGCKWVLFVVLRNAEETALFQKTPVAISKGQEQHETEVELCKNADMVITVGSLLKESFNSALHQCKKDHIFNLIPGIFDESFFEQQQHRNSKTFEILVFGRGNTEDFDHKGLHVAAEVVAQLNKYEPSYILKVVGAPEGEQEKLAESLEGLGISRSHLIVRSFNKERTKLAQVFSKVDLVLMPSGTGAFGLTALEALSAGVPILITHNSGLAEALEEVPLGHGCIVDQEADWAEQIKRVQKHLKTRLEGARMLRDNYKERYSWSDQCAAFVKKLRALHSGCAEEMQQESQGKRHSARRRLAERAKEMQQESQGKRHSTRKQVAGHTEEMQQESQVKRSSPRKRVAAGHPEEMQQESHGKRSSPRKRVAGNPEEMQQESQGRRSSPQKRAAGHPEEMQQESQGKRSSPRKQVAGHPEEMQQESQGKRSSPRKRVAGHPEEMQQESQGKRSSPRKQVAGYPEEMQQESQGKRSSLRKRVAGHPKEMQQESQGKRSSPRKQVAGHPKEMQQESQGKRSSPRKRVAGHPEEMQQESQGKRSSPRKPVAGHPKEMQQESQGKRSSPRKQVAGHPKEMQQESRGKRSSLRKRVAGHPKEMQQESQGKRSSLRKRVAASSSTEVNLEKERGSAAKKPKRVAIGEPGTSGVSSTSKTRKFKERVVTGDDLQTLGKAIGVKWDRLARRLPGVTEDDIEEIEDSRKTLSQRGFHMLKLWKTNNGEAADYKTLYNALVHELVQRKDLGEKYCLE